MHRLHRRKSSSTALADRIVQYGLTEVSSSPDPLVDVVFVHGLNGHPYNTWATTKPVTYWPADLLPSALQDQRCRILTYGYDANVTAFTDGTSKDRIHNHAEHLASRLVANRSLKRALERPIIFVAHSLGGLVVKRCLIHSKATTHAHTERTRSIYVSTYGVLFLGTPHNGSDLAKWGSLLQRISSAVLPKKFFDSSPQLVEALKTNNETLQNINRLFIEIIGRFRIYFFHESKPMDLKGTRDFVVDEDSAAPVIEGVERMGIERDHSHMCKFEDESAPGYEVVAEAIMRYADDAPKLIQARWDEERQIRDFEKQGAAREILGDSTNVSGFLTPPNDAGQSGQTPSMDSSINSLPRTDPQPSESALGPRVVTPLDVRPNSLFVGFQIELDQLYTKLHNKKRRDLGSCSVLVWGEVGSGKAHLVRQYFYKHGEEYPEGNFWVDARSKETILNGFSDIGASIGLNNENNRDGTVPTSEDFVDSVRKRLESLEGWLLVFDGISFESEDDLDSFRRFLPDRSGNNIIFTSVDRSLAKRQRLLNPSAVRVRALAVSEACELLLRNLSIRKPSTLQQAKAVELVKDYQCLPLAIHAASHALIEKGKALERYSRGISDTRLIHPFLDIMSALREKKHLAAINLIVLLSFFHHSVPVALIHYGYKALKTLGIDVLSPIHPESTRTNLDSTISILMRSGLLERTLQAYARSGSGHTSPEESRTVKQPSSETPSHALVRISEETPRSQVTEESSGLDMVLAKLQTDTDQSSMSSHTSTIDVLRIHTVVQKAVRDDLKDRSSKDNNEFWWWLSASVRLLAHSFSIASDRMRKTSGHGLVRDYREYEIQAKRLWSFFPKSPANAPPALREARHELHDLIRALRREIQNQSPSYSSDSSEQRVQGSIFERSSSTSEGEPETPTGDLTKEKTWSIDPARTPSESPTAIYSQLNGNDPLEWSGSYSNVIESDDDSWPTHSDTTEVPNGALERSRRSSALRAIFEGKPQIKKRRDLGEWKPMPAPPSLSQPNIQVVRSRASSTASTDSRPARPMTASSQAEAALTAVHKSSPPAPQAGRLRSTSRGNATMGERPALATRSPNSQLSPLASEFAPSEKQPLSSSSSPARIHSRKTSSSPRLVQALLTNTNRAQSARNDLQPLPIENVDVAYPRSSQSRPSVQPDVSQYSTSLQPTTYLPTGYTSAPMSRDASRESEAENAAAASRQRFHVGSVPLRTLSDPELHDQEAQMYSLNHAADLSFDPKPVTAFERALDRQQQRQSLAFGRVEEWVSTDPSPTTPIFPSFDDNFGQGEPDSRSGAVRFGGMEPVSLEEARRRAAIGRERSAERQNIRATGADTLRGRPRAVGLGIEDGEGRGKGQEKENIPLR